MSGYQEIYRKGGVLVYRTAPLGRADLEKYGYYVVTDDDQSELQLTFEGDNEGLVRVGVSAAVRFDGKPADRLCRFDLGNSRDTFSQDELAISPDGILAGAYSEEVRWGDMALPVGVVLQRGFTLKVPERYIEAITLAMRGAFNDAKRRKGNG